VAGEPSLGPQPARAQPRLLADQALIVVINLPDARTRADEPPRQRPPAAPA
jgi:hypothetical protein